MPNVSGQDPTKIMRGRRVRIYIDPTINADGTITLTATGELDTVAHANAKELGFTQDGSEVTVSRTYEDLPVDQRDNNILQDLLTKEPHLKVGMLQVRDWAVLQKIQPGTVLQEAAGYRGISDGLDTTFDLRPVCAVSPTPNDPTKFTVQILYACYNIADLVLKLSKEYNKTPLDFKGQDAGRADGKTFFCYDTL